jgi:hypothetical protein
VNQTSVQLRIARVRRHGQPCRGRDRSGSIRRTLDRSAAESRLAQLARFGLAITGKPLLELKREDA